MTTSVNINRQSTLCAIRDFDYTDFTSGVAKPLIYTRPGTIVMSVVVDIHEAWDSATSDSLTIGDTEGTDDVDRYMTSTSIATAGRKASVTLPLTNGEIETAEAITGTWTGVGDAPTAGAGRLIVTYLETPRSTEYNAYMG
jgi:hypothetical protein